MALPDAIAGALRPSIVVTAKDEAGTALDITGATISGILKDTSTGTARAIAGSLDVTTGASGIFTWTLDAADVVEGNYEVQFSFVYGSGPTPAKSFITTWTVRKALTVSA